MKYGVFALFSGYAIYKSRSGWIMMDYIATFDDERTADAVCRDLNRSVTR